MAARDMTAKELLKSYAAGERDFSKLDLPGIRLEGANLNTGRLSTATFLHQLFVFFTRNRWVTAHYQYRMKYKDICAFNPTYNLQSVQKTSFPTPSP